MTPSIRAALAFVALFVILLSASPASAQQAQPRVYEMRTYTAQPGRLEDIVARFRDHTRPLLERHGMKNVGYWIPQDTTLAENTLVYLISHTDREQARANWRAFAGDPEWHSVRDRSEANGPIILRIESVFLDPTDFSPLR